jgi:phosphate-selective porin OprO and OprP
MRKSWLFGGFLVFTITLGLAVQAKAQEAELPQKSLEQRLEELDQEIRILKRKRELDQEAAETAKKATPIVKYSKSQFSLESADGSNFIRFRGIVQADHRLYFDGASDIRNRSDQRAGDLDVHGFHDASDSWLIRRARLDIEATLFGKYDFRLTPDFSQGAANLAYGYIDARFDPAFQIRAGKFKSFVSLERLQSASDIKLIERSYVANALLPNRDVGIAAHGDLLFFQGRLDYAFGLVNGVSDGGDISTGTEFDGRKEFTGWLFATPFVNEASVLSGLGFGAAATYTDASGERNLNFTDTTPADATRNGLPSYRTDGQNTFFRYSGAAVADGARIRFSPQAYYYIGSLGILTEYARVIQDVSLTTGGSPPAGGAGSNTIFIPNTGKTLHHQAWHVTLSYLLTGETASFKGVKPKQNFDFGNGWGAWEIVGRYSEITLDEDTFKDPTGTTFTGAYANLSESAKRARSMTLGLNWYLNQNVRAAVNYSETKFDGGAGDGIAPLNAAGTNVADRPDERAFLTRLQFAF